MVLFYLWTLSSLHGIPETVAAICDHKETQPREQVHMPKLAERRNGKNWNLWWHWWSTIAAIPGIHSSTEPFPMWCNEFYFCFGQFRLGFLLLSTRVTKGGKYFSGVTLLKNSLWKKSNTVNWIWKYGGQRANSVDRWARRLTKETKMWVGGVEVKTVSVDWNKPLVRRPGFLVSQG